MLDLDIMKKEARKVITSWIRFYNEERPHRS